MAVKDKAPLACCSKERLIASNNNPATMCKDLESQLVNMQMAIHSNSIEINKTLEDDILSILDKSDLKTSPHINLFWQQQKKRQRYCLSLHSKSPSAYWELVSSGVLVLPSERVLRDYRNFFKPKPCFNEANVTQITREAQSTVWCAEVCCIVIWRDENSAKFCFWQTQQLTHLIIIDFIYHLWQKNYSGITNLKVLKIYNWYRRN